VLQRPHDTGILALVNGLSSAEDTLIACISNVLSSKEAVTDLRIALILGDVVTSIDAERVHATAPQLNEHGDDRNDF
jgi:hypothetical protein